jgi:signal transduction histidine kinase
MKRQITTAIVGVTAFILIALGIPLAIVAERAVVRSEVVRLQATAAQTLTEIETPLDANQLGKLGNEPDAPPPFAVYDPNGAILFGSGPRTIDDVTQRALAGSTSTTTTGSIVVSTPITGPDEEVVGALRLATSSNDVNSRVRRVWLAIAASAFVAIGCAWLIADRLGRRLASPIVELADEAGRITVGGAMPSSSPIGIAEIDLLRQTLVANSERVNGAMMRERQFSADVSHQLRTPLAAMRLRLEAEPNTGLPETSLIADLERLEATVDHLLMMARDAAPVSSRCVPSVVAEEAADRWRPRSADASKTISVAISSQQAAAASAMVVSQVLDVLIDNALEHGAGNVTVSVRSVAGGVAIGVQDEGTISSDIDERLLFTRHHGARQGDHHGIGLALASSLADAEGGRLVVSGRDPTIFSLILLRAVDDEG